MAGIAAASMPEPAAAKPAPVPFPEAPATSAPSVSQAPAAPSFEPEAIVESARTLDRKEESFLSQKTQPGAVLNETAANSEEADPGAHEAKRAAAPTGIVKSELSPEALADLQQIERWWQRSELARYRQALKDFLSAYPALSIPDDLPAELPEHIRRDLTRLRLQR
jgi:hypothetical protein